jgi:sugar-specific transcriptional regulator TrmB
LILCSIALVRLWGDDLATLPLSTELVKELMGFGLNENDAKTYIALLQLRQAPVRSIAKLAGISRQEIYRVLPKLEKLGLVESTITKPEQFVVIPPSKVLSELIDRLKENFGREILRLERRKPDLESELKKVEAKSAGFLVPEPVHFLLISGRRLINEKIQEMLEKAKRSLLWTSPRLEVKRAVIYDRDEMLRKCAQRGVKIRILTDVTEDNIEELRKLSGFAEIRHVPGIDSLITIVDNKEILMGSAVHSGNDELIHEIWTNDKGQISMMKGFFQRVWNHSKPAKLAFSTKN